MANKRLKVSSKNKNRSAGAKLGWSEFNRTSSSIRKIIKANQDEKENNLNNDKNEQV